MNYQKNNGIQEKVKNSLKQEFDSEPVYNEKIRSNEKLKQNPIMGKSTQIFIIIIRFLIYLFINNFN